MKPFKCPVCGGRGIVPGNFYTVTGIEGAAAPLTEMCRSCGGTGIVWKQSGVSVKLSGEVTRLVPQDYGDHEYNEITPYTDPQESDGYIK